MSGLGSQTSTDTPSADPLPLLAQQQSDRRRAGGRGQLLLVLVDRAPPLPANPAASAAEQALSRDMLGQRLSQSVRGHDLVIQRAGGEFLVALVDCLPEQAAMRLSGLLDAVSQQPVEIGGQHVDVMLAAGAAILADGAIEDESAQRIGIDAAIARAAAALATALSRDRGKDRATLVFDGVETIAGHRLAAG